jgi:hypothetical protein
MDISTLALNEVKPQTMILSHPVDGTSLYSDDGEPISITIHSADSDKFRSVMRQFGNKRLNEKKNKKQRMEELEEVSARILAKVTVSWENIVEEGKEITCTEENAFRLYMDYSWIREQLDEFVNDRSNFLKSA